MREKTIAGASEAARGSAAIPAAEMMAMGMRLPAAGSARRHDLARRLVVRLEEQIDKHALQRFDIVADLVIAIAAASGCVFQPVHGALASERRTVLASRLQAVSE